ncbi:MAG: dihydropteroate synthase [Bacteroidia bacterium]
MGILNETKDSFYDGSRYNTEKEWLDQTELMLTEGADIIDIGCVSTRPGSKLSDKIEESKQITKVLKSILKHFPETVISVDTYHASVASQSIDSGAAIINDISGGTIDSRMFETMARLKVPYILMHIKGIPETMHLSPSYNNVLKEIIAFFSERINHLHSLGLSDIIIDPGFGFGKTTEHNFSLMEDLNIFQTFDNPLLIGISRKSMIWKTLQSTPEKALNGTIALNTLALLAKANILRVHDVKEAKDCIRLLSNLT